LEKLFGNKIDFATFDTAKLEDARNKLRTQISQVRGQSGFTEDLDNEAYTKAQFMHDAIVAELADRQEYIVDNTVDESAMSDLSVELSQIADEEDYDKLYDLLSDNGPLGKYLQDQIEDITAETGLHPKDDFERIEQMLMDRIQQEFGEQNHDDEGGDTDDSYALASAGHGSDEDYESIDFDKIRKDAETSLKTSLNKQSDDRIAKLRGNKEKEDEPFMAQVGRKIIGGVKGAARGFMGKEGVEQEGTVTEADSYYEIAQKVYDEHPDLPVSGRGDEFFSAAWPYVVELAGGSKKRANYMMNYDEDFPADLISAYHDLQKQGKGVGEAGYQHGFADPHAPSLGSQDKREFKRAELQHELGHEKNNIQVSINGKPWKVFAGKGTADSPEEYRHLQSMKHWAEKKSASSGKKWSVSLTGAEPSESIQAEKFDPLKHVKNPTQGEKDAAKDVKRGSYGDRAAMLKSAEKDGRLKELSTNTLKSYQDKAGKDIVNTMTSGDHMTTDKSVKKVMNRMKGSEKADNKIWKRNESINTGEDMRNLREGEIQQASAIVTAKTMVDRVGRWIEELSGMENDTLLQLGDSIRDEMGQEQAKAFIEAVAPAIQQALENLKATRDTLSTGVRSLASGEQPADMLGGEPGAEMGGDMSAEPDMMNAEPDAEMGGEEDAFAAAEPSTGGAEEAGREQRESIQRSNRLMKLLAG